MKPQISFHGCDSAQQDKIYGAQQRVFNWAPKKGVEKARYRCTVCGGTKDISLKEGN